MKQKISPKLQKLRQARNNPLGHQRTQHPASLLRPCLSIAFGHLDS